MKKHVLAALVLLSSIPSFGAGYQMSMQGLRQFAQGGTGTAWPWDASTIYYNPGGLARLKSIQAYASIGFFAPATAYGSSMGQASSGQRLMAPFSIYVGGPIHEDSKFALGLGVYSGAGTDMKWDDNWIGRYITQSYRFQVTMFQPTLSYRIGDFLSVGAGFVYGMGNLDMRYALDVHSYNGPQPPGNDNGQVSLHGNANGVGFNAGIHLKPTENLQIGLTYRSQVNMSVGGGTAVFAVPGSLRNEYPNTSFDTYIPIPQVASLGIGIRATERLILNLDLSYTGWDSYDTSIINFKDQTNTLKNMHRPREYRNTFTARIGGNFKVSKVVSLMAGGYYDPTPVKNGFVSPEVPDADRVGVSCGIALRPLPRFGIIAAVEGVSSVKRTGHYNYGGFSGVYKTEVITPAIAVYYNF